jgi:hypothetical protein
MIFRRGIVGEAALLAHRLRRRKKKQHPALTPSPKGATP